MSMVTNTQKIMFTVAIMVVLLVVIVGAFIITSQTSITDFFSSIEPKDDPGEQEFEEGFVASYLSKDYNVKRKVELILKNFDPGSRFVYCDFPADFFDDDEKDNYLILCNPIIIDVPDDETYLLTLVHLYGSFSGGPFIDSFTDSWNCNSFRNKGWTIVPGGPKYMGLSYDILNYENECWGDDIETLLFISGDEDSGEDKLFAYPDYEISSGTLSSPRPGKAKLMVRVSFSINEPDETFNPVVTVCPNAVRS